MQRVTVTAIAASVMLLAGGGAALWKAKWVTNRTHSASATPFAQRIQNATNLEFHDLLEPGPRLRPSTKALSLNGKRVRLVGFMADLEEPPNGAFYLVSRPLSLDESGAGTGDLPLNSVLVEVPGMASKVIPHMPGALEGIGTLEVGNRANDEGLVSNFRLKLDADQRLGQPPLAVNASVRQ